MGNFTDKDMGWKAFMAQAKINSGETAGFAGFLRNAKPYVSESGEPITVAQIAAVQEFGNSHVHERSFMRSALARNAKQFKRLTKKVALQVMDGKVGKNKGLGILCQWVIDRFANEIESSVPPPNAPSTIARKGSSHTLIDSGQMKNSLDWEIRGKK